MLHVHLIITNVNQSTKLYFNVCLPDALGSAGNPLVFFLRLLGREFLREDGTHFYWLYVLPVTQPTVSRH